ncbi:glycoside hydrolase N-terminal domain-containing protein [Streptomyces sp. VNUA24]|uniref:glycosyl hydrolase family 95 catalytic domain-containing protein n=1 Tax=Streptomyces sp. VNUA24 TaxID=3031131 RepID=UPI0023B87B51|nr:glycoside hydrolase N-terminal domain-containing protein [Streptomyces sp. VNUA24]WEH13095.1 glycoside hydrolase N-terminal domain-containing protein [Streptomyces sp. VNUA24]
MTVHHIHDDRPADRWEDAFLSGNGEYGIMVHGDPHTERVVFNHHRFVLPNGTRDLPPPALAGRMEEIRDLILQGRPYEAQKSAAEGHPILWTQPFHPGYVMQVDGRANGPVRGYRRTTDFTTGEITVRWSDDTGDRLRRSFVSRADAVVVQAFSGKDQDLMVSLTGKLPGRPPQVGYERTVYEEDGRTFLHIAGRYPEGQGAYGFEGLVLLHAPGATVEFVGDTVYVQNADEVLLLSKLGRHETERKDTAALASALTELTADYAELLARHTALHTPAYRRTELDLGVDPADRERRVHELIAQGCQAALLERMFHSGRYLLLSSSGVLPPRLTGLWLGAWGAAWSGDFTTDANINLQMAGANLGGLPEVTEAYRSLVRGQIDHWRDNARAVYGARGLLAPSRTDGESGHIFHFDTDWPLMMWVAGADWLLYPLHEHESVSGERSPELAGWLTEAAEFFEDFLTRTDDSGRVVFVPSFSPENAPRSAYEPFAAVNATMDIAAARHALTVSGDPRFAALLDRLPPYLVDERGALAEWAWPGAEPSEEHRHVSHLYPVWPLHEITPDDTPGLARAAHRALELRGDENLSAHGSLHRAFAAARLKDAVLAEANLRKILDRDMVFRSLMTSHNPDLDIYNADAAHALPGLLLEMLVYTRPGVVELLPAPPGALTRGVLRGVRCHGGIVIEELRWSAESLTVALRSATAQTVTLVHRASGLRENVSLPAGEEVRREVVV